MYKYLTFDSGHEGLRYIINKYGIKKINLPYYLCDIVRHTLAEEGCKPVFYHIDDNFLPDKDFRKDDYILYPNYWGVCADNVKELAAVYPNLITDNAHAFYEPPSGFACFNAGHKFGYKDSYAFIQDTKEHTMPETSEEDGIIRHNTFAELHNKYKNINLLHLKFNQDMKPFVYPCLTESIKDADNLVKNLKIEGKTVFRYWGPLPKSFNEYKFYSRLVPIPVLPH